MLTVVLTPIEKTGLVYKCFSLLLLFYPRSSHMLLYTHRLSRILLMGLISISLLLSSHLYAENYVLMGRVQNAQQQPISKARLILKGPKNDHTQSDAQGIYRFATTQAGTYKLIVKANGYQTYSTQVALSKSMKRLNITLKTSTTAKLETEDSDHEQASPAIEISKTSSLGIDKSFGLGRVNSGRGGRGSRVHTRRSKSRSKSNKTGKGKRKRQSRIFNSPKPKPSSSYALSTTMPSKAIAKSEIAVHDEYEHQSENSYRSTRVKPLSTFSIDVDTASYANVRRFLNDGKLPPKDAVRIEEMINYFDYDYIAPTKDHAHPFLVHSELTLAPWNTEHQLLHIGIQGRRIDRSKLPASNLVFLLDVSGSMRGPDRLPLLKQALTLLAGTLRKKDKVSIVVYAGAAGVVLQPTSGNQRQKIINAFNRLQAGGSTAGAQGIQLAYRLAQKNFIKGGNNRVILATDGDFNVGLSSQGELIRLIEKKRNSGVYLTVLGFGRGNYRASTMSKLAKKGNGNHSYIDSLLEAQKVLVSEMGGTLFTIAKDVKVQIEFNPTKVSEYRLIGYESRILAAKDFNDDRKDAGELGAGHNVTALYELIPPGSKSSDGVDALKYQTQQVKSSSSDILTVKLRYKKPDGKKSILLSQVHKELKASWEEASDAFKLAAGVAAFAMRLQNSKHQSKNSWELVKSLLAQVKLSDDQGYRAELDTLVTKAQAFSK
jgi:Ca-activated chloride channel homolog